MNIHAFQLKNHIIEPISYDEFIHLFKDINYGNQLWIRYKEKVKNTPKKYKTAKYSIYEHTDRTIYFGNGLTRELIIDIVNEEIPVDPNQVNITTKYKINSMTQISQFLFRKEKYPAQELLDGPVGELILKCINKNRKAIILDGDPIKITSDRLKLFKTKGIKCVDCGLEGKYFYKEKTQLDEKYHLELYGVDKNGKEVKFTKDHIMPKSKGGADSLTNYQTMCATCNEKKSNAINVKDAIKGLTTEEIYKAKLSQILQFCNTNKKSSMTKQELINNICQIITNKDGSRYTIDNSIFTTIKKIFTRK